MCTSMAGKSLPDVSWKTKKRWTRQTSEVEVLNLIWFILLIHSQLAKCETYFVQISFVFLFLKQNLALFLQDLNQFQVISTFKLISNLLLYFKILKIFRC